MTAPFHRWRLVDRQVCHPRQHYISGCRLVSITALYFRHKPELIQSVWYPRSLSVLLTENYTVPGLKTPVVVAPNYGRGPTKPGDYSPRPNQTDCDDNIGERDSPAGCRHGAWPSLQTEASIKSLLPRSQCRTEVRLYSHKPGRQIQDVGG